MIVDLTANNVRLRELFPVYEYEDTSIAGIVEAVGIKVLSATSITGISRKSSGKYGKNPAAEQMLKTM